VNNDIFILVATAPIGSSCGACGGLWGNGGHSENGGLGGSNGHCEHEGLGGSGHGCGGSGGGGVCD